MSIADDMKKLTEDIIASHDIRVKALSGLVADTRKTVKDFATDRENMASIQAQGLSNFVRDLSKEVGNKLKDFQANLKKTSRDRLEMSDELKKQLAKDAKDITGYVRSKLKEFSGAHAEMSNTLRKDLKKAVKDISNSVKDILDGSRKLTGEYRSDMNKARSAWQGMSSAGLAKAGRTGTSSGIEGRVKVSAVKKSSGKKHKGTKKRKK